MSNFFVSSLKITNKNESYEDNRNNYNYPQIPKLKSNNIKLCSNNKNNDNIKNSKDIKLYINYRPSQLIIRKHLQKTEDSLIKMLILKKKKEKRNKKKNTKII